MNSKSVLGKIMTLLSMEEEIEMTYAKLKDGTIVESPTFDVGEPLEIVSEDGTKTPAPDGEHELALRDESGNENLIKVMTKDGVIVERENVELEEQKVDEEVVDKDVEEKDEENIEMADATTEEAKGLPNTTEEDEANVVKEGEDSEDPIIRLSYRIEEMEKKMKEMMVKMEGINPVEEEEVEEEEPELEGEEVEMAEAEEELPKLDGAPIDSIAKLSSEVLKPNFGKKIENSQSSFLSKLYK